MERRQGWHFLADSGTLRDGTAPPPDGEWLEHTGALVMCESGLHWSPRALDALHYAPGAVVCRVEIDGETIDDDDKSVSRRRRILWRVDATATLRTFARWCALQVIDLWDAPAIVREYLETGDESKREAAGAAAWDAARAAAGEAAGEAAGAAAGSARDAARDAAGGAARDAAWGAAWFARGAAWGAAWETQNAKLTEMLEEPKP